MNERKDQNRTTHCLIAGGLLTVAWLGVAMPQAVAADAGANSAGMVIYIDPQTGQILKGPAPGSVPLQLSPSLQNALSTSHQGLVAAPGAVPGGGTKVDLQGRFLSPLISTIDADGKVRFQHLQETAGSSAASESSVPAKPGTESTTPAGSASRRDPSVTPAR